MMKRLLVLGALLPWLFMGGCWPEPEWTDLRGSATDGVAAVFPHDATTENINAFLKKHTQGPPHPGGGYTIRTGIGAVIKRGVNGRTGYEICVRPHADPAEVSAIREEIKASPVVERLLEGEQAERAVYDDRL